MEPFARARRGKLTAAQLWTDIVRDLPQGLPEAGDRGLDFTPTWGRTYWGVDEVHHEALKANQFVREQFDTAAA